MRCGYQEAGVCGSCTLIDQPYAGPAGQLADKQAAVEQLLSGRGTAWSEPVASAEAAFRNKAKMVVAGTVAEPTLGILDPVHGGVGGGVDLRGCGLHEPVIARALTPLAAFVTRAALTPYDVPARRGELKHLLVTASPDGELMVRFVLRTDEALPRLRKHLPWLRERLPHLRVVSANLQPEHKAVLEGEREVLLGLDSGLDETLTMRLAGLELLLRPQGFFQTNTVVAERLYAQARAWVDEVAPRTLWDLYCGVGGFALACAAPGREVLGVEVSQQAVAGAVEAAARAGLGEQVRFVAADATTHLREHPAPDLVVVNPPRRGIGPLAGWLEASGVRRVLYSSCHAASLARDLDAMPSLRPVRGRVFDMFPQTRHHEVMVLLER